jgi:hypothetical protein
MNKWMSGGKIRAPFVSPIERSAEKINELADIIDGYNDSSVSKTRSLLDKERRHLKPIKPRKKK